MQKYLRITILFALLVTGTFPIIPVQAAGKFETTVKREYYLNEDLSVQVKEVETIRNNTSNLYIPAGSEKEFDILAIEQDDPSNKDVLTRSAGTVSLKYNSSNLSFTKSIGANSTVLAARFPYSVDPGESISFTLEYTHYGLMEENGALRDFFLNGFASSSVFEDGSNKTTYQTLVYVPSTFKEKNFVLPGSAAISTSGDYNLYTFDQNSLLDHYIWLQFGKTQFYHFKVSQPIDNSESVNTGNLNLYEIVIPRDVDEAQVRQRVFYSNISPEPSWIKEDEDGNLIAGFKLKSNFKGIIEIEGYAQIDKNNELSSKLGTLDEIDVNKFSRYLGDAQYWEVDQLKSKAEEIRGDETDISNIIDKTYKFVVDKIDYSEVKRFGLNERQGAAQTLNGGAAVCMEYSDLFLTLMRGQGIPSRAAFGYGYDPKLAADGQEAHQWVEVYSPALEKWIGVDVTWGENGDSLVGGDMNHLYTHVASLSPNEPPIIAGQGFGDLSLDSADYEIEVLPSISNPESLQTQQDLLGKYVYRDGGISGTVFDTVNSKIDAIITNLLEGEPLSVDQIAILSLGGILLVFISFGGLSFLMSLTKRRSQAKLQN
ncbi:transglutaminase domain-containing protein [Candidatus Dojkabacteria bacterium]|nr:transglutaminase domain-containing protein [Candidatus Dojkabacteria bacterium]